MPKSPLTTPSWQAAVQPVLSHVEARRTAFYLVVAALLAILPALPVLADRPGSTAEVFGVLVFYPSTGSRQARPTSSGQRPYAQRQGTPVLTTQALFARTDIAAGTATTAGMANLVGNGRICCILKPPLKPGGV